MNTCIIHIHVYKLKTHQENKWNLVKELVKNTVKVIYNGAKGSEKQSK